MWNKGNTVTHNSQDYFKLIHNASIYVYIYRYYACIYFFVRKGSSKHLFRQNKKPLLLTLLYVCNHSIMDTWWACKLSFNFLFLSVDSAFNSSHAFCNALLFITTSSDPKWLLLINSWALVHTSSSWASWLINSDSSNYTSMYVIKQCMYVYMYYVAMYVSMSVHLCVYVCMYVYMYSSAYSYNTFAVLLS